MPSEEFIASVDALIVKHISIQVSMKYTEVTSGEIGRNWEVEKLVHRAILGALESARKEIALRRTGSMTFDEAMQVVAAGKMVTRPGWGILRALQNGNEDTYYHCPFRYEGRSVMDFTLDNLEGGSSGSGGLYSPTEEDLAATDWMEYQRPEIDYWIDFDD